MITPPISGPAAAPTPPRPLIAPKAQAREVVSENHSVARMYTGGISNAVPTPSNTEFPRIRTARFGAAALTKAPTPYSVRPQMKHRLRPQRSVSLLHGIIRMAMISRNNVIAVCTPLTVVFRSSLMSVIITFMFEPAKLQMNWASASGRISLRGDTTGEAAMTASLATRSDARCVSNHIDAFSRQCPQSRPASWRPISRILRYAPLPSVNRRPSACERGFDGAS